MESAMSPNTLIDTFALGGDLPVNRIGYGAMRLTGQPGNFGPYANWEQGKALLRRAVDLGVTFIATARAYGPGWNEELIADALHPYAPGVVIATKGGIDKFSPTQLVRNASPATLRRQIEDARARLQLDRIDLFQLHWVDPATPLEVSVEALAAAREDGLIRHIGLSNVTLDELRRAERIAPIASVQNRFNSAERGDQALVDYTAAQSIAFIAYGPLGAHPMQRGAILEPVAALRWLLDRAPNVLVIPGTTSITHLEANLRA
jgi:pyridoxine 4-dehydrogenase